MAITLNNTPLGIYLSRNQAVFQLLCGDAIDTAAVREHRWRVISAAIPEDDTLTIAWSFDDVDYSVVFTFKDAPDAALYEIISNGTAPDQVYIEDSLIPGLLTHPDISEFFDIAVEEDTLFGFRLTSRVSGPITLTITADDFATSGGATSGVVGVREPNYLASAWLYVSNAHISELDEYTKLGEFELYPDAANLADIDVSQLLDDFFTEPETPTATTNAPVLCTKITRNFYLLYGQKFGNTVARKKQTRTDIFTVLKGGMTNSEFINFGPRLSFNNTGWRFLSLRREREVSEAQKDWLFIHTGSVRLRSVSMGAEIFYTDGTTNAGNIWAGQAFEKNMTYQMSVGFTETGIKAAAISAGKTCYKYTLQVGGIGSFSAVSLKTTFRVALPDYLEVIVEYENSLGGIESWRMTGERALAGGITAEQYRRTLGATPDAGFQQLLSFNEQDQATLSINTGPLSRTDALAYRDLLRARHKWIVKGTARIPFRTDPQSYAVDQETADADHSRAFTFQAILAPEKSISIDDPVWP